VELGMSRDVHDWVILDDLVVTITRPGNSDDSVWKDFAKDVETKKVTRCLGGAIGNAALTSVQRKIVADALKKNHVKVAAISEDRLVRGVITAVSWLGVDIKAFDWSQVREAAIYLDVPEAKIARAVETLMLLKNKPIARK
jgi:hypothetical protein